MRDLTVLMMALLVGCALVTQDASGMDTSSGGEGNATPPARDFNELFSKSRSVEETFAAYKRYVEANNESQATLKPNPDSCVSEKAVESLWGKEKKEATKKMTALVKKEIAKLDKQQDKDKISELNKVLDEVKAVSSQKAASGKKEKKELEGQSPKKMYNLFVDAINKKDKELLKQIILPSTISKNLSDKGFEKIFDDKIFGVMSTQFPTKKVKLGKEKISGDSAEVEISAEPPGLVSVEHSGGHPVKLVATGTIKFKKVDGAWKIEGKELRDEIKQ